MQVCLRIFLTVALVFATGLQWSVLQSVAWVGMVAEFSKSDSFDEAVKKTFSGEEPCELCIFVSKTQETSEEKQTRSSQRLNLWVQSPEKIMFPATYQVVPSPPACHLLQIDFRPPTPPPEIA